MKIFGFTGYSGSGKTVRVRIRARDVALALELPRATTLRNIVAGRITRIVEHDETLAAWQLPRTKGPGIFAPQPHSNDQRRAGSGGIKHCIGV